MIAVDYREGSHDLIEPLQALGLDVAETDLPFGDLAFTGRGNDDKPVEVGIEFKQLGELVAALRTGRLQGHQLIGMSHAFDYRYLLVEGELIVDRQGRLLRRAGRRFFKPLGMSLDELYKRLHVLQLRAGIMWTIVPTRRLTLDYIRTLYRTWTDKPLDEHESHIAIYNPGDLEGVSQFRRTVSTLPGIGLKASAAVEDYFDGSLRRAFSGSTQMWAAVKTIDKHGKTRKLGHKIASRIEEAIR